MSVSDKFLSSDQRSSVRSLGARATIIDGFESCPAPQRFFLLVHELPSSRVAKSNKESASPIFFTISRVFHVAFASASGNFKSD